MTSLPQSLVAWLEYIERVHPRNIEMGLERVRAVKDAMALAPVFPLIIVGGTNGKGSACMMLEAILHHAGYKVACYTSPHLLRYNERVRIARAEVDDAALMRAFEAVELARVRDVHPVPLTYFEFGTLAAMWLFAAQRVDVGILEVGLGGRLDAVNVFDADCAMVMSVDIDHIDYLGDTREKIGYEKAGIFRAARPAVCADADPPHALIDHAQAIGARLLRIGNDFSCTAERMQWRYRGPSGERHGLPLPALRGAHQLANAAACITALDALREKLPVTMNDIRAGLLTAENPGRFQVLPGRPLIVLDVAHNPHAARALAANLRGMGKGGRTLAVFSMLADKDIAGVIQVLKPEIDYWYVAGLAGPRGVAVQNIAAVITQAGIAAVTASPTVAEALRNARDTASENDKILVFGSFHTVSEAMAVLSNRRPGN